MPESTAVSDTATLSGTNASTATGTVTYSVYSDSGCTTAVSAGTAQSITTPGTLPASSAVTLGTPGTYYWQASYSGDSANAASMSTCGSEVETVTSRGSQAIAFTPARRPRRWWVARTTRWRPPAEVGQPGDVLFSDQRRVHGVGIDGELRRHRHVHARREPGRQRGLHAGTHRHPELRGCAQAAATGNIALDGSTITVQRNHEALIKLTCTGTAMCSGRLTLTVKRTTGKGKKRHTKTQTIGTATFSIPAGKSETVKLTLNGTGRALLSAAHGHLSSTLTILKASPSPSKTQTHGIHLVTAKSKK